MSKQIPQVFLDDLIARTDLVEVIEARVKIQKKGQHYSGLCPFHNEKTPSFSVNPQKQFYYCFGCGAHGNAIGFLMAFDRMEFLDAVADLSARLGLEIPSDTNATHVDHKPGYELLEKICHYYEQQLREAPDAIEYLKARGLTGKIAKYFSLGYARDEWDALIHFIGQDQLPQLITYGFAIQKEAGKCYDRFRGRIMFPIRDYRGRIIAFGGRILGDGTPKYINSPETPLFHKSDELYGLYETLQQNREPKAILVVEGYLDVIALHQHGITNAVAALGTATNPKHVQKLFRYAQEIVFCFDGDNAGRQAAWKALTSNLGLLHDGVQIRFMFLPQGDDPDTLVRRVGKEGFLQRLEKARVISEVFFELIKQETPLTNAESKARFAKEATHYLQQIPHGIFHNLMFEQLARELNMYTSDLNKLEPITKLPQKAPQKLLNNAQKALGLLLQEPKLCQEPCVDILKSIPLVETTLLCQLIELMQVRPTISVGEILAHCQTETDKAEVSRLAARRLPFSPEAMIAEFEGAILRLQAQYLEQETEALVQKAKQNQMTNEERKRLTELLTARHKSLISD